jgi:hypothetical protein
MCLAPTLSRMAFATVVLPEPVPPAIPMIRGVARLGIVELYWNADEWIMLESSIKMQHLGDAAT